MSDKYDSLKLENQLCFPLYACSKELVRRYKPALNRLDLTYTQYIAMMVMWEHKKINVTEIGRLLYLDSGTLTPVLKKLEQKGLITRSRCKGDERCLDVCLTDKGEALKEKAVEVPGKIAPCLALTPEEAGTLYSLLRKTLAAMGE
ncbi:MAG: MarR family transcriptional regulator [Clostridia bacterium]|nr:MarR family transcriptional regulator [Clostridia bacterium]